MSRKRIVVTRTEDQSESVAATLKALGAAVLVVPTIRIEPVEPTREEVKRISAYCEYDIVIFTSYNCVKNFFHHAPARDPGGKRPVIVAIGKKTAEALSDIKLEPDIVPSKFSSDELIKGIANLDWRGRKVLIPRGSISGNEIKEFVESSGGIADEVIVYRTVINRLLDPELKDEIASGKFDTVAFFSPSQARNFVSIFGPDVLEGKEIAAIGPTTRNAIEEMGLHVDVIPGNATTEELIASLIEHEKA